VATRDLASRSILRLVPVVDAPIVAVAMLKHVGFTLISPAQSRRHLLRRYDTLRKTDQKDSSSPHYH